MEFDEKTDDKEGRIRIDCKSDGVRPRLKKSDGVDFVSRGPWTATFATRARTLS